MPIIPLVLVFSYAAGLFFTCMVFNKELIYYRTALAGSLATSFDNQLLAVATKSYDLSVFQITSSLHSQASLVCSLFAKLFTSNHVSVAAYASCLSRLVSSSMHVFLSALILAVLHVRMRPGSCGRFFFSAVFFGSAAFNLLSMGSLFLRTFTSGSRAVAHVYNQTYTLDLTKGVDGVFSATKGQQLSQFSMFPPVSLLKALFHSSPLFNALGLVAVAVTLSWVGKRGFSPGADYMMVNGISVLTPQTDADWLIHTYYSIISLAEQERFRGVGIALESIKVDPVTGWYPVCYYYRHSFIYDFKSAYLAFHNLGHEAQINWAEVMVENGLGSQASYNVAAGKIPYLSFKDPNALIVNLLQKNMYHGVGVPAVSVRSPFSLFFW